jgi:hypothetical protein
MTLAQLRLLLVALLLALPGCRGGAPPTQPSRAPATTLPAAQAASSPFHDVAAQAGISVPLGPRDPSTLTIRDVMGCGCAFLDYDGDGKLDILLVGRDRLHLYHNLGNGKFEDVTARAFHSAPETPDLMGCSVCDYDQDGRPDIFVTGYGHTILYHNEGDGTFRDVTAGSGLEARDPYDWTTSAAWADVDGDGKPDLYVCRYVRFTPQDVQFTQFKALDGTNVAMAPGPQPYKAEFGSLYHNDGGGHFHDITARAGLGDARGKSLGCMFCDFNGDGKPDLFIANDTIRQDLYLNVGGGRFRNIAAEAGVEFDAAGLLMAGMGIDWGDYDNDGRFDLLVSNFSDTPKALYHNQGGNLFVDNASLAGIAAKSHAPLTFGANFVDVDNDGWLDIVFANGSVRSLAERIDSSGTYFEPCMLFHNEGNGRFEDWSGKAGPDFTRKIVGRGTAVGDYDGDGRLDLLIVNAEGQPLLLHNDGPVNHYLGLRCLASGGKSYALGARVTVKCGSLSQIREVRAAGSYLSTDAPDLHFGLGSATTIDSVSIRWPDGHASRFTSVRPDHVYVASAGDTQLKTAEQCRH